MYKVLLATDLLKQALVDKQDEALQVIKKVVDSENIQPWMMSSSVMDLALAGVSGVDIQTSLKGITQIPVNARLSAEALDASEPVTGLLMAAAKMFKINRIITDLSGSLEGVQWQTAAQFLADAEEVVDRVDFLDLKAPLHSILDEVDGNFMEIIQNTAFAGGTHVAEFEKEFAEFSGSEFAIGVSSGTDALRFALMAMGIGEGDEVITVPNTFIATTEAISQVGAKPVFVDVLPGTYNMNPALIEEKLTDKTKAIVPVHLYGQPADMDPIMEIARKHNLKVLEDACQAHGAWYKGKRAGTLGHAAAFSMYPGKNLGAFGEGGAVTTNDEVIADMVKCLREHGQKKKYYHLVEGYNGRMDNLQGASLRAKLKFIDGWNNKRRQVAAWYKKHLAGVKQIVLPEEPADIKSVYHLFVILAERSSELHEFLMGEKVFTGFHYPVPLHLQDAYRSRHEKTGSYPVTEDAAARLLSLPMFPELTEKHVEKVAAGIKKFYA